MFAAADDLLAFSGVRSVTAMMRGVQCAEKKIWGSVVFGWCIPWVYRWVLGVLACLEADSYGIYTVLCDTLSYCLSVPVHAVSASNLTRLGVILILDADAATPTYGLRVSKVVCKMDMCTMLDSSMCWLPLRIAVHRLDTPHALIFKRGWTLSSCTLKIAVQTVHILAACVDEGLESRATLLVARLYLLRHQTASRLER